MCGDCSCGGSRGYGHGPGREAGSGYEPEPHFGRLYGGPTKSERKEWLEGFKKHLEERLSEVNEDLSKL